jgi:glycosyltransferase involved in cell wall biosynthesis
VVATAVGGNPELLVDGQTGELVPPGDVEAMAASIAGLAGDPVRAAAMGAAGRERAEQFFSLSAMVGAYRQLYDRLLAERHTTSRLD